MTQSTRRRAEARPYRRADLQVGRPSRRAEAAPYTGSADLQVGRSGRRRAPELRTAVRSDARRIFDLIERNQQAGHLLPRQLSELTARIERFVVAVDGRGSVVACGELAPLSPAVAEIRSLVVSETRRGEGLGHRIVGELRTRAQGAGYGDLCVFAHQPAYFAHMGFSIVPHTWLPEKITADCRSCPLFRKCEQFAMVMDLDMTADVQPGTQLHV
jgi:amino-acid N-acetyltransferase